MPPLNRFSLIIPARAFIAGLFTFAPVIFLLLAAEDLLGGRWSGRTYFYKLAAPQDPALFTAAIAFAVLCLPVGLAGFASLPRNRFDSFLGAFGGAALGSMVYRRSMPDLADILYAADWPELQSWAAQTLVALGWMAVIGLVASVWRAIYVARETRRLRSRHGLADM